MWMNQANSEAVATARAAFGQMRRGVAVRVALVLTLWGIGGWSWASADEVRVVTQDVDSAVINFSELQEPATPRATSDRVLLRRGRVNSPPVWRSADEVVAESLGAAAAGSKSTGGPTVESPFEDVLGQTGTPLPRVGEAFQRFNGPAQIGGIRPPDPIIAVGNTHMLVAVNTELAVYLKNGSRVRQHSWDTFFQSVVEGANIDQFFDPKVLYDPISNRFFVIIIGAQFGATGVQSSSYFLAVTNTDNPTGEWTLFRSDSTVSSSWSDYPGFGVDANAIYVTANYFSTQTQAFTFAAVRVYGKAQFLNARPGQQLTFVESINVRQGNDQTGRLAFTIQPAVSFSNTSLEWMVSAELLPDNASQLFLYSVNGGTSPRSIRKFAINLPAGAAYTEPPFASQPGNVLIDALDGRVTNVWRVGDRVWAAHGVQAPQPSFGAIRWYEFDVSNANIPTLRQTGLINVSNTSCIIPAICADALGDAIVTYTRTSAAANEYPSMYYSTRTETDPAGAMPTTVKVDAGLFSYEDFRWGDYAGAVIDPSDGTTAWLINEVPSHSRLWRTSIARVPLSAGGGGPPPTLCPGGGAGSLTLLGPLGGETWVRGQSQQITWTGAESDPDGTLVNLLLARFNRCTQQSEVIGFLQNGGAIDFEGNTGSAFWTVGEDVIDPVDLMSFVSVPRSCAASPTPGCPQEATDCNFADYQIVVQSTFCPDDPDMISASPNFFRIIEPLQVSVTPATQLIVRGESATLTAIVSGGMPPYYFRWRPTESLDNPNIFRPIATPLSGRRTGCDPDLECVDYTVEVTDASGLTAPVQAVATVKIGDPLRVDAGPTKTFAPGGTVLLEGFATGGGRPYTYSWNPIPDPTQPPGSDGANVLQPLARPTADTTYTLTVTDRFGMMQSDSVTVQQGFTVTILNQPTNGGTVTRDVVRALYLPGEQIVFSAAAASGFSFLRWEIGPTGQTPATFSDNPLPFAMPSANVTVTAVYSTSAAGGGTSRPQTGTPGLDFGGMLPTNCATGAVQSLSVLGVMFLVTTCARVRRRVR